MTQPGRGNRYFFIPALVWIGVCISLVHDRWLPVRRLAVGCLLLLPIGMLADFYYPGWKPTDFPAQARRFEQAPVGTRMAFAVHPPDFPPMVLTKR
jgi:hypothetical protein